MAELDSVVGAAAFTLSGGGAPVTINNRFHRWRPRDFNALAVPSSSAPSAGVMTATKSALDAMGQADVIQEYEKGTYWVDGSVSPSGYSTDPALGSKMVYFNDTTIRVSGIPASNFQECYDQQTGNTGLSGKAAGAGGSNLPAGATTRVLFDVTNTERSVYNGKLTLDGGNVATLALIAASAVGAINSQGGLGSTWGSLVLRKSEYGLFGTPKYADARNVYAPTFVGNIFNRIRIENTVNTPMLIGGNQCDDCFIGELNIINKSGARSYLFGNSMCCGTLYTSGTNAADFIIDIQKGTLRWAGTFYCEGNVAAAIYARALSFVEGQFKYGGTSSLAKLAFLYADDVSGAGIVSAHPTFAPSDAVSVIKLKAATSGARNYHVVSALAHADVLPFAIEAGSGSLATNDKLTSFMADGLYKWTVGGTSGSPTCTGASLM